MDSRKLVWPTIIGQFIVLIIPLNSSDLGQVAWSEHYTCERLAWHGNFFLMVLQCCGPCHSGTLVVLALSLSLSHSSWLLSSRVSFVYLIPSFVRS